MRSSSTTPSLPLSSAHQMVPGLVNQASQNIFSSEVTVKGHPPFFVAVVYRPPHAPFLKDTDFIDKITTHMHDYSTKIILGDFNADQLSLSDDAVFVRKFIAENGLQNVPFGATHHKPTSDTWLDLCLVDEQDRILDFSKTESPFINGHDLITATLALQTPKPSITSFTYRDYNAISAESLNDFLSGLDWSVAESAPLDECVSVLQSHVTSAINTLAPVKTVTPRKNRHPWFTPEHRVLIQERDRLYKRFRRSRTGYDLLVYREARDLAHRAIEEARNNYYHLRLSTLTDPKDIWRELEHLGITGPKKSITSSFSNDQLNAHFRSVSYDPAIASVFDFLSTLTSSNNAECFIFREFQISDICDAVNHFSTQARGPDGIPQRVIQLALPFLAPIICKVFNQSLREACFPQLWKKSSVIALNKVSTPKSLSDFRPISLLCFLSKALEWLVYQQMSCYLESRLLLNPLQTGFRSGHSTQTALLKLSDDIRLGINRKRVTLLLLFDFSKAFDSVCHVKLLHKLLEHGFSKSLINWIASYLVGRQQAVVDNNGNFSSFLELNTGVPQGSVLGPLLFAIYVNDLPLCFDHDVSHIMYADDLQLYISCPLEELDHFSTKMSANADRIMSWASLNKLRLNVDKTKAMVIGSPYYINSLPSVARNFIVIGGTPVVYESSIPNLGVVFDSKLNWNEHIAPSTCSYVPSLLF